MPRALVQLFPWLGKLWNPQLSLHELPPRQLFLLTWHLLKLTLTHPRVLSPASAMYHPVEDATPSHALCLPLSDSGYHALTQGAAHSSPGPYRQCVPTLL